MQEEEDRAGERQARLQEKLHQLKQRLERKSAHQVVEALGIPAEQCVLLLSDNPASNACVDWLQQSFPWVWGQIDKTQVPESVCLHWGTSEERSPLLHQLCQAHQLGNPTVNVIWFSTHNPILELSLDVVCRYADAIFLQDWDTWIIDRTGDWCIECYHEGQLSFCPGKSFQPSP